MIAKRGDDEGLLTGSPLTVELAIEDLALAERVRAVISEAPGLRIVGADEPAHVRIAAGTGTSTDGAPHLMLIGGGDGDDELGAAGMVSAHIGAAALCTAIRATALGLSVFSAELREATIEDRDATGLEDVEEEPARVDLTPRELEVLRLLTEGASNKIIARRLQITSHTAKFHVASIIAKLGATGRTDAVTKAMRLGLVMI